jgi:hypothetical protein
MLLPRGYRSAPRVHRKTDHEVGCGYRYSQRKVPTLQDLEMLDQLADDFTWER